MSGAKDRRPALDQLLADAKRRRFDVAVCWGLDRLGRNLKHLSTPPPPTTTETSVSTAIVWHCPHCGGPMILGPFLTLAGLGRAARRLDTS